MSEILLLKSDAHKYMGKMIIDEARMTRARDEIAAQSDVRATPDKDLRYIEGLLDIPYGYVSEFFCIPAQESMVCACGREPNAADIVATALRKNIHSKQTIRDAVLGLETIFESSQGGREGACLSCSGTITLRSYWTRRYLYA